MTSTTASPPRRLSLTEAAAHAGRSAKTLSRWIAAGDLRAVRDRSGRVLIDQADLDCILEPRPIMPAQAAETSN